MCSHLVSVFIQGPSQEEVTKENKVKRGITGAVSKALKAVQKENINTEDRAVYRLERLKNRMSQVMNKPFFCMYAKTKAQISCTTG